MLKLMWQKGDKHGLVGEWGEKTSSASSWAWWHFAHLVPFRWWQQKRWPGYSSFWIFSAVDYQCWREKKNLLPMYSQWGGAMGGQAIHIQGSPQRANAKKMGLNLQINQKHSPGNWKRVIQRQTVVHKYNEGSLTFAHTRYSNMRQTCSYCHYTALSTHAYIVPLSTPE